MFWDQPTETLDRVALERLLFQRLQDTLSHVALLAGYCSPLSRA